MEHKILCLHGWRTNARVLAHQSRNLQKSIDIYIKDNNISSTYTLHYLEAPRLASEAAVDVLETFGPDNYYEWWHYEERENELGELQGVEDSILAVEHYVAAHGPFCVALGFSQGSAMLALMNALYAKQDRVPWNLSIHVSGYLPIDSVYKVLFEERIESKVICVQGENDFLFRPSQMIPHIYDPNQCTVHLHAGGHKFPSFQRFQHAYQEIAAAICQSFRPVSYR